MAGPVVWINGFPGTGKLTIARELALIYIRSVLIDNHQLIDPVAARFSRDHPQYQAERKRLREWVFEKYVLEPTLLLETVIFTGKLSDSPVCI
jgi:broad-specificity NMP kinase